MLKREITFKNFNDEQVTKTYYFNLSKSELIELELGEEGGLAELLQTIVESQNTPALIKQFKRLVLLAYGEKSADGERFVKSDEIRNAFEQTAAYDALFSELATSDDAASTFINAVVPREIMEAGKKAEVQNVFTPPPPVNPILQASNISVLGEPVLPTLPG